MPITRDGPVTQGTRANLIEGLRTQPMCEEAVAAALEQAVGFSERLVEIYSQEVAHGEVGPTGSGHASEDPILGERAPTALLYGRVQSGKTAAMILATALCLDNNFKIIVVLTADNVALVDQTANRFRSLHGPRVFSSLKDETYEWEGQIDEIRQDIANDGLVLVCAKDSFHLPHVIRLLQQIEAAAYPALIFDDEADAATPDTTQAARSSGRANAPRYPSTINRRVIENLHPEEEGESINEVFSHALYVQVTAMPYLLFLQRSNSRIRPNQTFLLEPGAGYCGGDVFFGLFEISAVTPPAPPLVMVADNEGRAINRRAVPAGLAASMNFFLVASATRALANGRHWPAEGFKHLSHTSHRINQHEVVVGHIETHLNDLRRRFRTNSNGLTETFSVAHQELQRTDPHRTSLTEILPIIRDAIRQADIIRVNSEADVRRYGPRVNFLIGGNILGRGLTIDDLLVTYYIREAQVSQMDTVWQHARMYGYRQPLMPFTRVYLPRRVAARFRNIHLAEEELRSLLRREARGETVPVRVALGTRPTRPNATEPSALRVIEAGRDQVFPRHVVEDPQTASRIRLMLINAGVPVGEAERSRRSTAVPLEQFLEIVEAVPVWEDDSGRWTPEGVAAMIESYREQYSGRGNVYVRGLEEQPDPNGWTRGRLSGPEIRLIRDASPGVPALALMHWGPVDQPLGWYPTLVMPPGAPAYILNPM